MILTKAVFRQNELITNQETILIEPPQAFPELARLAASKESEEDEDEKSETYDGPTVEDMRREAEAFKAHWEVEKEALIISAKTDAATIVKEAEEIAFQEVKRKTEEAQVLKRQAEDEAERIIAEAKEKAKQIENEARVAYESQKKEANDTGFQTGREEGYNSGKAEVERLIQRMQTALKRAQDKRSEILAESEQQIVDLVLLIARKVIKVISESQKTVVISNVVQALRKLKTRGTVIIRVNMADVKLTTEHIKDFIRLAESAASIQVQEDSSVDTGGCVIETDFGEVDARISSQLAELESKILEMSPIKTTPKPPLATAAIAQK
ncbi:MAG: flagellar assembly protein FliH [Treponema sp.]|jgi:flagellar assembly protein FliH|nr:flagellar assembly protein FliH [Treponema sp.]